MARIVGTTGSARPAPKPTLKPKAKPAKPFVLKTPHDVGTTAQPPRRGHAPTVFQQPLGLGHPAPRTPTAKMVDQQARHVARGVLHSRGITINRPLKQAEVHAILSDPGVKADLKSALPFIPKDHPHHGLLHNIVHGLSDVGAALTARGNDNGIRQSFVSHKQADKLDRAIQKGLNAATSASGKAADLNSGSISEGGLGPSGGLNPSVSKFLHNFGKDAGQFPANTVASTYMTVAHPEQVAKSALDQLKHPVKSFEQHPLTTALVFKGGFSALSRGGGAALREGVAGKAGKEFASTERPPLRLAGNATVQRRYSKGLAANRAQKLVDKGAMKKRPATVTERGKQVPAIQATEKQLWGGAFGAPLAGHLGRRIDLEVGTNAGMLRHRRDVVLKQMAKERPPHQDAVPLVLEGILKEGDQHRTGGIQQALEHERDRLTAYAKTLTSPSDKALNRANVKRIDKLLTDKEFLSDPRHSFEAAKAFSASYKVTELEREHFGDFTHAQARRRVLIPFAQRELGVEFNHDTGRFEQIVKAPEHVAQTIDRATAGLKDQLARARTYAAPSRIQQLEDQLQQATADAAKKAMETARTNASGRTVDVGLPVSDKFILEKFKDAGGKTEHLAYVKQYKDIGRPVEFRGGPGGQLQQPGMSKAFHGYSTRAGTYHRSYIALAEQMAHAAARVERHYGVNELTNNFGHVKPDGSYFHAHEAPAAIRDMEHKTGERWVARTVARQTAPQSLIDDLHPAELEHEPWFRKVEAHDQHVVLFPARVFDRINQHENLRSKVPVLKAFQVASQYFRHTVLPVSPKWLAGNTLEAGLRLAINDPTLIRSIVRGHRLEDTLAKLSPEGLRAMERLRVGAAAGHYASQRALDYYRPDDGRVLQAMHNFRQQPGAKTIGDGWEAYRDWVFRGNTKLESSVYYGGLGKELQREVQSTLGSWVKTIRIAKSAYEDVANGLLDSNNVARYVQAVDDMRGRYQNLSPSGRAIIGGYTPFGAWFANALYFLAVTMPVHHPVLTGALAGAYQGSAEKRKEQSAGLPPWAQAFVNGVDLSHFTPMGVATTSPLSQLHQQLLPQALPIALNFAKHDWTLANLPKGANPIEVALNTALETFVPPTSRLRIVLEKGGVSRAGSSLVFGIKTKPGTKKNLRAGFNKALNPFRGQTPSSAGKSGNPLLDSSSGGGPLDSGSSSSNPLLP